MPITRTFWQPSVSLCGISLICGNSDGAGAHHSVATKEERGRPPQVQHHRDRRNEPYKILALNHDPVRDGITLNTVGPGSIMISNTVWDATKNADPVGLEWMLDREFPLGRLDAPEEFANVVAFVRSQQAILLTGVAIPVVGGESTSYY